MSLFFLLFAAFQFLLSVEGAIYEDQIDSFDWYQRYVGKVIDLKYDKLSKQAFVLSEENVIGSVTLDGKIGWRRVFTDVEKPLAIVQSKNAVGSVFSNGIVRLFNSKTGDISWEDSFVKSETESGQDVAFFNQLVLALSDKYFVAYDFTSGKQMLNIDIESSCKEKGCVGKKIIVNKETQKVAVSIVSDSGKSIFDVDIKSKTISKSSEKDESGSKVNNNNNKNNRASLKKNTLTYEVVDEKGVVSRTKDISLPESSVHGQVESVYAFGDEVFVVTSDAAFIYFNANTGYGFTREEALASLTHSLFVDLPGDIETMKVLIEEFSVSEDSSLVTKFIDRFVTQFKEIKNVVNSIVSGDFLTAAKSDAKNSLTGDIFNLRQMIIGVSSHNKVFAIFSASGELAWSFLLEPGFVVSSSTSSLMLTRSVAHIPREAVCVLIGQTNDGAGLSYSFDPIKGDYKSEKLNYQMQLAVLIDEMDSEMLKPILILDSKNKVHVVPDTSEAKEIAYRNAPSSYFYFIKKEEGSINGLRLVSDKNTIAAVDSWNILLPVQEETIVKVASYIPEENVKVQFKIIDHKGNVMYKYLNPNLISLASLSKSSDVLTIYFIDTVVGRIIFRISQKNAGNRPVTLIHSENSVYYHYWNKKDLKYVLVALDLYEGGKIEDRQPFSSFSAVDPVVVRQAYIFNHAVSCASITVTQQAITMKQILLGLSNGQLFALDKKLVDTRRAPSDKTAITGVPPYNALLPLNPLTFVNYNRTVANIRGIVTSTTHLESHGLVFIHGLDLYSTRITPSNAFDMLSPDFNKPMLLLTATGVTLAVLTTRHLLQKKKLNKQWE